MKKTLNSLKLKVGDLVQHNLNKWVGRVIDVEYNNADEAEIEWLGKGAGMQSPRTSQIYLTKVEE